MRLIKKTFFSLAKPKIIFVEGNGKELVKEAITSVLGKFLKIKKIKNLPLFFDQKEIILLEKREDFEFLMKESSFPILILTHFEDISSEEIFFASEKEKIEPTVKIIENLPVFGYLILNHDDETVRELKEKTKAHFLTLGFAQEANLKASDVRINHGTNFKLHYNGTVLPVWLEKIFGREQIYTALTVISIAKILKLNLVEVSMAFKNYKSLPGKMRVIEGIKNSWILDDSESATHISMIEALEILGKINWAKRKIAVLGDVTSAGKYAVEAHETIGEKVAKNAEILFTFGQRAKFIAKGAFEKGMDGAKIFEFNTIDEGKPKLKAEINEGDLILVDGSKEMEMSKIVEEIKISQK